MTVVASNETEVRKLLNRYKIGRIERKGRFDQERYYFNAYLLEEIKELPAIVKVYI